MLPATQNKNAYCRHLPILLGLSVLGALKTDVAAAQSVTAAIDGTGTNVTQSGQQFDVEGGSLSANGENLFHSFQTFQPAAGEQVNFLTPLSIQSVFARVSGGAPSVIDGQLQLLGSQANLFLINPSGIVFGPNATLNLPANFTATTADAIGVGNGWFNATGPNDYAALVGEPNAFAFGSAIPGSVINGGKLSLGDSQQLALVGGSVINTGTLSTPGGAVTIAAVPGESLVRISNEGQLLTLEIAADLTADPAADLATAPTQGLTQNSSAQAGQGDSPLAINAPKFTPLMLPELLTQSGGAEVTQLITNTDGTVSLINSEISIPTQSGTAIAAGRIDVSSPFHVGGGVAVLGDRVALLNAHIEASGLGEGGRVLIGGDYQGQGPIYQATQTFIDASSTVSANAFTQGNGGRVIAWAEGSTQFWGNVTAIGGDRSGDGGFVEVSGKESLIFRGTVDVSAANGTTGSLLLDPETIRIVNGATGNDDAQLTDNEILFGDRLTNRFTISENTLEALAGNADITLQATKHIIVEDLADDELSFRSGTGTITWLADADQDGSGNITVEDLDDTISAPGRSLVFSGNRLILGELDTASRNNDSGSLTLQATQSIETGKLSAQAPQGEGGTVNLSAGGKITTGVIHTAGLQSSGDVTITTTGSSITTGNILTETFGSSATVTLSAPNNVVTGEVTASELTANAETLDTFEGHINPRDNRTGRSSNSQLQRNGKPDQQQAGRSGRGPGNAPRAVLDGANASAALSDIETARVEEFSNYFGRSLDASEPTPEQVKTLLAEVRSQTDNQSVVVYIKAPSSMATPAPKSDNIEPSAASLEILIFTATGDPISLNIPDVSREQLFETITEFRSSLVTSVRRQSTTYLPSAQQLYSWLIQPIEDELGPDAIDTVLFSMDSGLRSLPIAALHDGEQFLIEKYSVGMVPSLALMDSDYQPMEAGQVLAMGASTFESLQPLLAVPTEIETIGQLWQSREFLNETFTRQNLIEQQFQDPAQIIHLATHAAFNAGDADNSYIQLWNEQLYLSDIHTLGWDSPAIDLLVLSACQTALGNPEAEMGFAGLAVAAGAKSALASLWSVSDVGTLALMGEFYSHLRTSSVKAEALQQAQLAMLNKDVRVESGELLNNSARSNVSLPANFRP